MPLVTSKEMFKKAYEGGYAIGAFNVNNMEIIQGITEAAMEERAPFDSSGICWCQKICKAYISGETG
jgi:fructose/tagatose bisphosphate aldolase